MSLVLLVMVLATVVVVGATVRLARKDAATRLAIDDAFERWARTNLDLGAWTNGSSGFGSPPSSPRPWADLVPTEASSTPSADDLARDDAIPEPVVHREDPGLQRDLDYYGLQGPGNEWSRCPDCLGQGRSADCTACDNGVIEGSLIDELEHLTAEGDRDAAAELVRIRRADPRLVPPAYEDAEANANGWSRSDARVRRIQEALLGTPNGADDAETSCTVVSITSLRPHTRPDSSAAAPAPEPADSPETPATAPAGGRDRSRGGAGSLQLGGFTVPLDGGEGP